jgi:hypothetical protein
VTDTEKKSAGDDPLDNQTGGHELDVRSLPSTGTANGPSTSDDASQHPERLTGLGGTSLHVSEGLELLASRL